MALQSLEHTAPGRSQELILIEYRTRNNNREKH